MGEGDKNLTIRMMFNGNNYLLWSGTTKTAICGKGLWSHVEPSRKAIEAKNAMKKKEEEEDDEFTPEEEKWFQDDQVVLGALQSSLELSILEAYWNEESLSTMKHKDIEASRLKCEEREMKIKLKAIL